MLFELILKFENLFLQNFRFRKKTIHRFYQLLLINRLKSIDSVDCTFYNTYFRVVIKR